MILDNNNDDDDGDANNARSKRMDKKVIIGRWNISFYSFMSSTPFSIVVCVSTQIWICYVQYRVWITLTIDRVVFLKHWIRETIICPHVEYRDAVFYCWNFTLCIHFSFTSFSFYLIQHFFYRWLHISTLVCCILHMMVFFLPFRICRLLVK